MIHFLLKKMMEIQNCGCMENVIVIKLTDVEPDIGEGEVPTYRPGYI